MATVLPPQPQPPEGAALLVAGHGVLESSGATLHTLGQIGEALLETARGWQLRRLAATPGERETPSRASLKRYIVELADQAVPVAVLAMAGFVVDVDGEPSLVTGPQYTDFAGDSTLPLAWIRDKLRACRAESVVVVLSTARVGVAAMRPADRAWLDALGTARPGHVVAVDPSGSAALGLAAFLTGLRGAAVDKSTGTITLTSIGEHLQRGVPGLLLQASREGRTLAHTPPLGGPWDARLSTAPMLGTAPLVHEDDPADLVGTVLPGQFRIDRVIARGGFGTVYQAHQLSIDRDVAVKVLHATVEPTSDAGRLFVHEIQSVGRIEHANVVRIYQADVTGRSLFFAMELLAGKDLQQLVETDGPMPQARAIELVQQLLAGLAAAHAVGLVHADVKPANAIVVGDRLVLVDFGLSRLRATGAADPLDVAGGTPAYMAPEQLREGRVDSRSDVFAAALVLVTLLTGWRRRSASELVPPLDTIEDAALRTVLARALATAPDDRYQTARELARALGGQPTPTNTGQLARPPFRHLAPFTEADRDALRGRDRDIASLVEHVLYRRSVIYTAPSGTGKTSLLRAGLAGRLDALGLRTLYLACRSNAPLDLAAAIWPGASNAVEAVTLWHEAHQRRLVIVIDQLEAAITGPGAAGLVTDVVALDRARADLDVAVVLSIREDYLAGLFAAESGRLDQLPVIRLGPLRTAAAREAIVSPLVERRIAIDEELLVALLADLRAAAAAMAAELHWLDADSDAVYPPHLQLACSVLYDSLRADESVLTLAHYRRLGGLDAIVGEYLDRVLDTELPPAATAVARELLVALVTPSQTRAFRTDRELTDTVSDQGDVTVAGVLDQLRAHGLVVRQRSASGDVGWELVHDSLVPRVSAWLGRGDHARRRAAELVRYHLRRSTPAKPSLLISRELSELRGHAQVVAQLDREWAERGGVSPGALVAASRRAQRIRRGSFALAVLAVLALVGAALLWGARERERRLANLGRFHLELKPYDWDLAKHAPRDAVVRDDDLTWDLYSANTEGEADLHALIASSRDRSADDGGGWAIDAPGGEAVLVVTRSTDWRCQPSHVPLRRLPGYTDRDKPPQLVRVRVPTCAATRAALVDIPAGDFVFGGAGEPPIAFDPTSMPREHVIHQREFAIDRTEVTNAAFAMFTRPANDTNVDKAIYVLTGVLEHADEPDYPVTSITWSTAHAYCRFVGGELPTNEQWEKALRGPSDAANRHPRRNLPWDDAEETRANLGPAPLAVERTADDRSPYGVLGLAGNVAEWTASYARDHEKPTEPEVLDYRVTRGCDWANCKPPEDVTLHISIENTRAPRFADYSLGFRCAVTPP